jgi:flagellar biosynthesis GTPase FlhF
VTVKSDINGGVCARSRTCCVLQVPNAPAKAEKQQQQQQQQQQTDRPQGSSLERPSAAPLAAENEAVRVEAERHRQAQLQKEVAERQRADALAQAEARRVAAAEARARAKQAVAAQLREQLLDEVLGERILALSQAALTQFQAMEARLDAMERCVTLPFLQTRRPAAHVLSENAGNGDCGGPCAFGSTSGSGKLAANRFPPSRRLPLVRVEVGGGGKSTTAAR